VHDEEKNMGYPVLTYSQGDAPDQHSKNVAISDEEIDNALEKDKDNEDDLMQDDIFEDFDDFEQFE